MGELCGIARGLGWNRTFAIFARLIFQLTDTIYADFLSNFFRHNDIPGLVCAGAGIGAGDYYGEPQSSENYRMGDGAHSASGYRADRLFLFRAG
jgi:hypothetical protein